jgi:hypothetical protein
MSCKRVLGIRVLGSWVLGFRVEMSKAER